jgi:hypothetical protein
MLQLPELGQLLVVLLRFRMLVVPLIGNDARQLGLAVDDR